MFYQPKKSFRIDDILQPAKPLDQRPDAYSAAAAAAASWPSRPTPVYLGPLPTPAVHDDYLKELRDARLGHTLTQYYPQPPLMDPLRSSHMFKGFGRCWSLLPSYPLPILSRQHSHPNKRKGGQVRFTMEQTMLLERRFGGHKYLSPEERRHLAGQLKLSDRQVKTWFQNRRAKWRRVHQASVSSADSNARQSEDATSSTMPHEENIYDSPPDSPA